MITTEAANVPERLETLAVSYIANNLTSTICVDDGTSLKFRDHVNLPYAITDLLFKNVMETLRLNPMQKEPQSEKLVQILRIFTDKKKCKLRRIILNRAPISDDIVQILVDLAEAHPLVEVDLTDSSDTNANERDDTPPYNHAVLLSVFLLNLCGETLQKLVLDHSMFVNSINQLLYYTGKKAKVLGQDQYMPSHAAVDNMAFCLSKESVPVLSTLDISNSFFGWFFSIDPLSPPPITILNANGYHEVKMNQTVKQMLKIMAYGEEDYVKPEGKKISLLLRSKSPRKMFKYDFFRKIMANKKMLSRYLEAAGMEENLVEDDRIEHDYNTNPKHNYVLRHLNLLSIAPTLHSLSLYNSWLSRDDFDSVIFTLKSLQHLDVSWPARRSSQTSRYRPPGITVWLILQNLPELKSLDVSGTDYAEEIFEKAEVVVNEQKQQVMAVQMTQSRGPLNFLGLWDSRVCSLHGIEKLALKVTGSKSEEQMLFSLETYITRSETVVEILSKMMSMLSRQQLEIKNPGPLLKLCMRCSEHFPTNRELQTACASSMYYVLQRHVRSLSDYEKHTVILDLITLLERNSNHEILAQNCMAVLFSFELPDDVMFIFERITRLALDYFDKQRDVQDVNVVSGNLCHLLVGSLEPGWKARIKNLGFFDVMMDVIQNRMDRSVGDDVMETAWSALWNATDETPVNCEEFVNMNGTHIMLECYKKFTDHTGIVRNMMGLMGNISEVNYLRHHLAKPEMLNMMVNLLRRASPEVCYNACGVLSNLLVDDSDIMQHADLADIRDAMRTSILSWRADVAQNINYKTFDPIITMLRCPREPTAHLWALWAMRNMCDREGKYVRMVITSGGEDIVKSVMNTSADEHVKQFASDILKKM